MFLIMSNFDSLTIVELKQRLKQEGLPLSGNKAELIERLITHHEGRDHSLGNNTNEDLPFLSSIKQNGFSSVQFDLKIVIHYGITMFMLILFFIGLNSNSWYLMENTERDGDPEQGMYVDETITLQFGLGDIELLYEANGIAFGYIDYEETESIDYDGTECRTIDEFSCDSFSTAGTIVQICLWISILCILLIFGLEIAKGFGKEMTAQLRVHEQTVVNICWALCATLPLFGALWYRIIVAQSEMNLEGWDDYGFGGMWITMIISSVSFIAFIYYQQFSSLISKLMRTQ